MRGISAGTPLRGNQRLIKFRDRQELGEPRGAVRRGEDLLANLFRCGHCGRKLHVAYGGTKGDVARYHCQGASINMAIAAALNRAGKTTGKGNSWTRRGSPPCATITASPPIARANVLSAARRP